MFSDAWVTYTHISHTNSGKKDNATPLFDWGKYYEKDGKTLIPVSVQAHHSFVDGLHIGQFVEKLQGYLMSVKFKNDKVNKRLSRKESKPPYRIISQGWC